MIHSYEPFRSASVYLSRDSILRSFTDYTQCVLELAHNYFSRWGEAVSFARYSAFDFSTHTFNLDQPEKQTTSATHSQEISKNIDRLADLKLIQGETVVQQSHVEVVAKQDDEAHWRACEEIFESLDSEQDLMVCLQKARELKKLIAELNSNLLNNIALALIAFIKTRIYRRHRVKESMSSNVLTGLKKLIAIATEVFTCTIQSNAKINLNLTRKGCLRLKRRVIYFESKEFIYSVSRITAMVKSLRNEIKTFDHVNELNRLLFNFLMIVMAAKRQEYDRINAQDRLIVNHLSEQFGVSTPLSNDPNVYLQKWQESDDSTERLKIIGDIIYNHAIDDKTLIQALSFFEIQRYSEFNLYYAAMEMNLKERRALKISDFDTILKQLPQSNSKTTLAFFTFCKISSLKSANEYQCLLGNAKGVSYFTESDMRFAFGPLHVSDSNSQAASEHAPNVNDAAHLSALQPSETIATELLFLLEERSDSQDSTQQSNDVCSNELLSLL
jgi:hypothetical protein